jgi:colanic acid/amylovoran biosynthesis glycosyltransferase
MNPAYAQITSEDSRRPNVVIFRRELLLYSETFIANQARALHRYSPVLVGTRRGDLPLSGLSIDAKTVLPTRLAKLAEFGMLHGAAPPRFHRLLRHADLVHAHFGPDAALLVPALSRAPLRATPLIATFHGFDATVTDDGLRALGRIAGHFVDARPALFARANTIVAVSEFVRTRLVAAGADPRKVIVHYIGIDTAFFWAPARSEAPPPSVLFLGRLHQKKGAGDLLRALARLREQGLSVACTIAGTGPEEPAVRRLAHDLRLDVRFVGAVDAPHARDLLHATRILCVPSMTASSGDAEGFGLVFAEAQACGVPVVSYRSGGVPEAVADEETGLLAPERDIGGLGARLHALLTDDDRWLRMSACGRERTVTRFDLERQTQTLERIYDDCRRSSSL